MGQSYIVPKHPWFIEPTTIILAAITLGYTAPSKMYMMIIYFLFACAGCFNYLYNVGRHRFSWVGNFQTFTTGGQTYNVNITDWNGQPVDAAYSLFTQDDIGKLSMLMVSYILMSLTVYYTKKFFFGIVTWKRGKAFTCQDAYQNDKVVTRVPKLWSWKGVVYVIWTIAQTFGFPFFFQLFSWQRIQQGIPMDGTLDDNPLIPWNTALVGVVGTIWFVGWALVWFLWLWPKVIDKTKCMMLSAHYMKEGLSRWAYYFVFQVWIWFLYVTFLANHAIWSYTVGPGHSTMIFILTFILAIVHIGLTLYGYFVGRRKAMNGNDYQYKELEQNNRE